MSREHSRKLAVDYRQRGAFRHLRRAIPVEEFQEAMHLSDALVRLVIVDACRNRPRSFQDAPNSQQGYWPTAESLHTQPANTLRPAKYLASETESSQNTYCVNWQNTQVTP